MDLRGKRGFKIQVPVITPSPSPKQRRVKVTPTPPQAVRHNPVRLQWALPEDPVPEVDPNPFGKFVFPWGVPPVAGNEVKNKHVMQSKDVLRITADATRDEAEKNVDSLLKMANGIHLALGRGRAHKGIWHMDRRIEQYLDLSKILAKGTNGVAAAGTLHDDKLTADVVVKTAISQYNSDRLDYEYFVNRKLNTLRELIPHFSMVVMLYACMSDGMMGQPPKTCVAVGKGVGEFMVVERISPGEELDRLLRNKKMTLAETLSFLVMMCFGLQIAQDQMDFTHYDLHARNVLIETVPASPNQTVFIYNYDGQNYYVPLPCNRFPVFIDFGRAHVRKDNESLKKWGLDEKLQSEGEGQWATGEYGINMPEFNTWHDILHIWDSVLDFFPKQLPPDVAEIERDIEKHVKWEKFYPNPVHFKDLYYRFPIAVSADAKIKCPIDLALAIMKCEMFRGMSVNMLWNGTNTDMFVWNNERERGKLNEKRTREELEKWRTSM